MVNPEADGDAKHSSGAGFVRGFNTFRQVLGSNYSFKFAKATFGVYDKTKMGRAKWLFRFDKPHKGAMFDHININPKVSGIPDPHIRLPPGGMQFGRKAAQAAQVVNKVAMPVLIAVEVYSVGCAGYQDYTQGTYRNTIEKVSEMAGGFAGGTAGATSGAALGTLAFPGVGTLIGGLVGGICGGISGSWGASSVASTINDHYDIGMVKVQCNACNESFKIRHYLGETDKKCSECMRKELQMDCVICGKQFQSSYILVKQTATKCMSCAGNDFLSDEQAIAKMNDSSWEMVKGKCEVCAKNFEALEFVDCYKHEFCPDCTKDKCE